MTRLTLADVFGKLRQFFRDIRINQGNEKSETVNIAEDGSTITNIQIENLNVTFVRSSSEGDVPELNVDSGSLRVPYASDGSFDPARFTHELFSSSDKGSTVSRSEAFELRREYYESFTTSGSLELLEFYRGIVPESDLKILRASLFVRELSSKRESVRRQKRDITDRYGDRGRNICNMVNAGYFDTFLRRLYNADSSEFHRIYEIVVTKNPLAVFVSDTNSVHDVVRDIKQSLRTALKHRIADFVNVHAFGADNVLKVEQILNASSFESFRSEYYARREDVGPTHTIVRFIPIRSANA